ncbi:MAG: hypothetical protein Q9184_008488, partial [Pyrenodesmia sp. 2 TL-2023]
MPGAFLDDQDFSEDPYEIVEDPTMEKTPHADSVLGEFEEDNIAETSTGYEIAEDDSDDDDEGRGQFGYEVTEDSSGSEPTVRPLSRSSFVGSTRSTEPATSGEQSVKETQLYGEDLSPDSRLQKAINGYLMSVPEPSDPPPAMITPAVDSEHSTARPGDHNITAFMLPAPTGGSTWKSIPSERDTQGTTSMPFATNMALTGSSTVGLMDRKPLIKPPLTPRVARKEEPTAERAVSPSTSFVLPNMGGLTSENLALLQADTSGTASAAPYVGKSQRSNIAAVPFAKMMAAEDYMQEVWEAASTRATSVLSARTRQALSSLGPGVVWQDRNLHYVEQYAKVGKAAAVRELLLAGCNPGTTKKPNYRPLTNAVRAGTLRHNKVVQ